MISMMRKYTQWLAVCLTIMASPSIAEQSRQISVTGNGQIMAAPDMAQINVGVSKTADTAAGALAEMSTALEQVLQRLSANGVAKANIQTSNLRLDQQYDHSGSGGPKLVGYTASSDLTVVIKDLNSLGAILDAVVSNGANQMHGLVFGLSDDAEEVANARRAAVADARLRAQTYAEAADVQLGDILMISDAYVPSRPSPMRMEMAMDSGQSSVPIASGELRFFASVSIIWALE